jgi:hypothetical protein
VTIPASLHRTKPREVPLRPDELIRLLTSQRAANDVADAVADPSLQAARGWNLAPWTCQRVPGAILFTHQAAGGQADSVVVVLATPQMLPPELVQALMPGSPPITILVVP